MCWKIAVSVVEGTHDNEVEINRQLKDKERVAAAKENFGVMKLVAKGIRNTDKIDEYI